MSSTFVVVQGHIVKARVYSIPAPNGQGRPPLARLVFEVENGRNGSRDHIPVMVQGSTVDEVQAFLTACGDVAPEAIAQGQLRMREQKAEVHAHRVSFLLSDDVRMRAVEQLRSRSGSKEEKWKSS